MCRPVLQPDRRAMIALLAATPFVAGCMPQDEGPEEIRWGRETCAICGMIISDPRFGAEVRGGAERDLLKFDDIGEHDEPVLWIKQARPHPGLGH